MIEILLIAALFIGFVSKYWTAVQMGLLAVALLLVYRRIKAIDKRLVSIQSQLEAGGRIQGDQPVSSHDHAQNPPFHDPAGRSTTTTPTAEDWRVDRGHLPGQPLVWHQTDAGAAQEDAAAFSMGEQASADHPPMATCQGHSDPAGPAPLEAGSQDGEEISLAPSGQQDADPPVPGPVSDLASAAAVSRSSDSIAAASSLWQGGQPDPEAKTDTEDASLLPQKESATDSAGEPGTVQEKFTWQNATSSTLTRLGPDVPGFKPPSFLQPLFSFLKQGNLWAAGGVLMLLLGFGFLINYMAEHGILSLEMRIAGTAVCGLILVGFGISLREKKREYALVLQGGGVGIVYLSAYAATKMTTMLSPLWGLVLISALLVPAVGLAVIQNSQLLALFAFSGGFAAPVLLSDGSGNYVGLFSYYLLLNCGVIGIRRFREWPWLNMVGAAWTFGVYALWMVFSFEPEMFRNAQVFLTLFTLTYLGLGLRSCQGEATLKDPVRASLLLGVPAVAIACQWYIARSVPHGLSVSSVLCGMLFIGLGAYASKHLSRISGLSSAYLITGLGLVNLALPLELSGSSTSAAWALEAVVFYFLACRTGRSGLRSFAAVFLALACCFLVRDLAGGDIPYPLLNGAIVSLAFLACAWLEKHKGHWNAGTADRFAFSQDHSYSLSLACLAVWFLSLAFQCWQLESSSPVVLFFSTHFARNMLTWNLFFLGAGLSAIVFFAVARKAALAGLYWAELVLFLLTLVQAVTWLPDRIMHLGSFFRGAILTHGYLSGLEGIGWLVFAASQVLFLVWTRHKLAAETKAALAGWLSLLGLLVLTSSMRAWMYAFTGSFVWLGFAGILPGLVFVGSVSSLPRRVRLEAPLESVLLGTVPVVVFSLLGIWFGIGLFDTGNPYPLPIYIPLLNPLEIQQAATIIIFILWQMRLRRMDKSRMALSTRRLVYGMDLLVFIWLHSVIIRTIHFVTGASFADAVHEKLFKVLLTALWGLFGLAHVYVGNKFRLRPVWVAGALLVGADCAKVMLFDFVDKGTLFHVASFFVMGAIFLLIGLFAPLPPSFRKIGADTTHNGPEAAR